MAFQVVYDPTDNQFKLRDESGRDIPLTTPTSGRNNQ